MLLLMVRFFLACFIFNRREADAYIFHGCETLARVPFHLLYGTVCGLKTRDAPVRTAIR
jgi:hypothetical protein